MLIKSKIYESQIFLKISVPIFPKKKETRNRINYCLNSENEKIYLFLAHNTKQNFKDKFKEEIYKRKSCPLNILKYFSLDFFKNRHNSHDRERAKVVKTHNPLLFDHLLDDSDIYMDCETFFVPSVFHYAQSRQCYGSWPFVLEHKRKYYKVKKRLYQS